MEVHGMVTSYKSNGNSTLALTIPKSLREKMKLDEGKHFIVKLDGNKIIYEKLE